MRKLLHLPGIVLSISLLRKTTLCFLFSLVSMQVFSQAELLADINISAETTFNEFSNLRDGLGKVYYVSLQQDLWVNYFNSSGEEVAMKLRSFAHIDQLLMVGSTLYFSADDGSHGEELWKSNGTAAGTLIVKDIWSGSGSGSPQKLIRVNNLLYFTATNNVYGRELWKSNGLSSGTVLVKDIFPKGTGSNPGYLTNVNGIVFFSASDGPHGYELWKSDGSSTGTVLVKDIRTAYKISSGPQQIVNVNGVVYFTATEEATGREL
jgi:ELWxxDGT repeat protein